MNESNFRQMLRKPLVFFFSCQVALLCFSGAVLLAQEIPKRPPTEELLPETTVAYLQIDNLQETLREFVGRDFLEDENVAPFIERIYQEAEAAYVEYAQEEVGMTLQQIRDLPAGELCIAVIAPRRKNLEVLVAIEIDPESESVEAALASADKWKERLRAEGLTETVEQTEEGFEIYAYEIPEAPRNAYAFVRDGWFVSCTSRNELVAILARWEGLEVKKVRPLSQNRKFVTIMNRCRDTKDIKPEMRFFVDPISMARGGFRGNAGALAAMNFLPTLGLDGLLGFGGSAALQDEEFLAVFHAHLLLANPRAGILEMLALKPGASEPQPWVPVESANYLSTHWDPQQLIAELEKLIDTFAGEGEFEEKAVGEFQEKLGLDLHADIIDTLDGRITFLQWCDPDSQWLLNATCNSLAIGVNDVEKTKEVIEAILTKAQENDKNAPDPAPQIVHEGVPIWMAKSSPRRQEQHNRAQEQMGGLPMRMADPAFCLLDNSLVICDSLDMIKHLINVSQGKADSLTADEEYNDQMQTLMRAAGSDVPCMISWSQPAGPVRDLIKLVNDDRSKGMLDKFSEKLPFLGRLRVALDEQPMPDYEQVERYLRPAGAIVTTDDTGYHFLSFQYRPKDE